ncbi:hypothetical protein Leryth_014608 [Lithospermum erythrorhizon]|nr:hypothetical protein Leryth_014608 [Lithospermum erythrorhizon]
MFSYPNGTHIATLHNLLQRCAKYRLLAQGKACHAQIIHLGYRFNCLTSNILINTYSKCGLVESARKVFDQMPYRTLVSWNTILGAYTQNADADEALGLFVGLHREGSQFNEFTLSSVVCACAAKLAVFECRQLHAFGVKASMDHDVFVGTALLDVYAKSSLINDAFRVFKSMPERTEITWSSMMAGCVQNELHEEALALFHEARRSELKNDAFIVSSSISACAALAASIEGKQIHCIVVRAGFGTNQYVSSALVDMYAKCGTIKEAYSVFSNVEEKNIVLMTAMISAFAKHARALEVMILFQKLQQEGLNPTDVTYVCVLSACAHMGLVEMGKKYFSMMTQEHNLSPNVLHYACMVDVLARNGLIQEAKNLIDEMPFQATASIWGSLLASCRVYKNVELGEIAAKQLFEIEPSNAGNHVLLSNIYAANKQWEEVASTRKLLRYGVAKKERGKSWIETKNRVHSFMVGERSHPQITEIYSKLEDMLQEMNKIGYRGDVEHDLHDVKESRKKELLKHHSEKLAFTYGLMSLPPKIPIRIMKNLRICGDCHSFMKLASKLTTREIIVRDNNRFHHFRDGTCSCGEFW